MIILNYKNGQMNKMKKQFKMNKHDNDFIVNVIVALKKNRPSIWNANDRLTAIRSVISEYWNKGLRTTHYKEIMEKLEE